MKNKSIFSAFPQTNNEKTDSSIIKYMAYIIRQIDTLKYDELLSLSLICQSIDCMREPDTNNYPLKEYLVRNHFISIISLDSVITFKKLAVYY